MKNMKSNTGLLTIMVVISAVLVVVLCMGSVNVCESNEISKSSGVLYSPEDWGPYGVGYLLFDMIDNDRNGQHVPVVIYYPSKADRVTDMNALSYTMKLPFAAADSGSLPDRSEAPYPVIVFSHGQASSKNYSKAHNEFMASHGYIVIACDHIGSTSSDNSFWPIDDHATLNRIIDVIFILDHMKDLFETSSFGLNKMGDINNVGMCGHSYGGSITALMSGAILTGDTAVFDKWEKVYWKDNNELKMYNRLPDKRIKAAISMAGDGAQRFYGPDGKGFEPIKIPYLYIIGKKDNVIGYEKEGPPTFKNLSAPSYLLTLFNEGHVFPFMDPNGKDALLTRGHRTLQHYACAFWNVYLKNDQRYAKYLTAEETAVWNKGYDDLSFEIKPAVRP
jgi:predicted dienelactone hydrolase